jgi:hypothetical protein
MNPQVTAGRLTVSIPESPGIRGFTATYFPY